MKSVITLAVGKKIYIEMALNLAKSFLIWNKGNGIEFILVTDRIDIVAKSIIYKDITVIEINTKDYDDGFAIKLHLDKFIKTNETVFIDCDCLVYNDLTSTFEKFENHSFSSIGEVCNSGDFFGNVSSICKQFGLDSLPRFVGAVYFVRKSTIATEIFEYARQLKPNYDDIGLVRLRGKENEEPLLAISMAKHNQKPILDDGLIKADRMSFSSIRCNVLNGKCELFNKIQEYPTWNKLNYSKPIIAHFNASFSEHYVYKAEVMRLRLFYRTNSKMISNFISNFIVYYPGLILELSKMMFRPIYHKIFGVRRVSESSR